MASRLGVEAVNLAHAGHFGVMIGVQDGGLAPVDLREVMGKNRPLDLGLYKVARTFF
jgi:6-phosphofructokinase